ncbi:hypothetical protein AHAS_Ahas14G0202100 [Arachis hypogaea]
MPPQPPLPPQHRPPSVTNYHSQYLPQTGANIGTKPPASGGPTFPQGQNPLLPSQQSSQSRFQVGNMPLGPDFGSQAGSAMQVDRGSSWMPGPSENPTPHSVPPGPPSVVPGLMGASNQPLRPPACFDIL